MAHNSGVCFQSFTLDSGREGQRQRLRVGDAVQRDYFTPRASAEGKHGNRIYVRNYRRIARTRLESYEDVHVPASCVKKGKS
jgi:hypothetical protein